MSAFRLQTITPDLDPSGTPISSTEHSLQMAREAGYKSGFIAGQAAAIEKHLEDQGKLTCELVEALSDAGMTNEAARRHVAASLTPMVEALVNTVAPALAEAGIVGEIGRMVAQAIDAAPDARPLLRCSPELAETLKSILSERGLNADVEAAADLMPREAQVIWDQGYDKIDLDACIAEIQECLTSHLNTENRSDEDDRRRSA